MFFKRICIFIDIKISSVLVQFFSLTAICQQTAKTNVRIRKGNEVKTYKSVVSERNCTRVELRKGDRLFSHWRKIHGDRSRKMCIESRFCRLSYVFDKLKIWIFLLVGFALYPPTFTLPNSCVIRYYLKLHRICRERFRVTLKSTGNTKYVPK